MTAQSAIDARNKRRNPAGSMAAMVDRFRLQAAGKKGGKNLRKPLSGDGVAPRRGVGDQRPVCPWSRARAFAFIAPPSPLCDRLEAVRRLRNAVLSVYSHIMAETKLNFADPQHCLCFNLRRAARRVTRAYDDALAPAGLTAPQFSALAVLMKAGPLSTTAFADAMETERTTSTRNLSLLEAAGLIRRKPGEDRRVRMIAPTPKGRRAYQKALPYWRAAQRALVGSLGAAKAAHVVKDAAAVEAAYESAG